MFISINFTPQKPGIQLPSKKNLLSYVLQVPIFGCTCTSKRSPWVRDCTRCSITWVVNPNKKKSCCCCCCCCCGCGCGCCCCCCCCGCRCRCRCRRCCCCCCFSVWSVSNNHIRRKQKYIPQGLKKQQLLHVHRGVNIPCIRTMMDNKPFEDVSPISKNMVIISVCHVSF